MSTDTLVVIGNGFDLWHGLKTQFPDYGRYLKAEHTELYRDCACLEYALTWGEMREGKKGKDMWSDFETSLANLDWENELSYASTDFGAAYVVLKANLAFCHKIPGTLRQWLETISIESEKRLDERLVNKNYRYLSFNYTPTLPVLYGIDAERICYIHGSLANQLERLICGHNVYGEHATIFRIRSDKSGSMVGCNPEDAIREYLYETYKKPQDVIQRHEPFFTSLSGVRTIYVLGHSMSSVDEDYFLKLAESVGPDAQWIISYFSDRDRENIEKMKETIQEEYEWDMKVRLVELDEYARTL